jgi:hypothetical protein
VQAQIRARGDKTQNYSCKDIALLAEDYMAQHNHRTNQQLSDVAPTTVNRRVPQRQPNAAYRQREYLTEAEVESLAHYLGHRNPQSTARYTALAEGRFAQFWKDCPQPPNKSTSFSQLSRGNNKSLSSNFLASVSNLDGKALGTS